MSTKRSKSSFIPTPVNADELPVDEHDGPQTTTGRVKFDDRGNAVWEWAMTTGAFGAEVATTRLRTLEHPALSIADEAPPATETVRANPLGVKKGYDPYDSGKLAKARGQGPRKKDLRKLSEWVKLKKQAEDNKKNQTEPEE